MIPPGLLGPGPVPQGFHTVARFLHLLFSHDWPLKIYLNYLRFSPEQNLGHDFNWGCVSFSALVPWARSLATLNKAGPWTFHMSQGCRSGLPLPHHRLR